LFENDIYDLSEQTQGQMKPNEIHEFAHGWLMMAGYFINSFTQKIKDLKSIGILSPSHT
jgi:hypothetical protein